MIKSFVKKLVYFLWIINGYLGVRARWRMSQRLTVLITYYNPVRMKHADHQVRNLAKCDFIERMIISNHNPHVRIQDFVKNSDKRVIFLNQETRRGCGYRWLVADQFAPEYLLVLDDDLLLFPWQIKNLFAALLVEPETPHGFAGMVQHANGSLTYFQRTDRTVDYLCEGYAITGGMLKHYLALKDSIQGQPALANSIESTADFVIVSRTGRSTPRIHHTRFLLRCPTFNQAGVAVHKEHAFVDDVHTVAHALDDVQLHHPQTF